ncbi:MAG: glycosyltransferase, partial [Geodermatophilaceae bacterium]|nr:glycosyltransferase [Geodermatophilaceae bacterium]
MSALPTRVACIIPAKDEQQRIAATVTAARTIRGVEVVIVCDDGSRDATAQHAGAAGAIVVSHTRNRGKATAVESAVNALGVV